MKKKALPVGTMFLVLVIALSVLGVGYALWSETLTIQGNVQTGEVDVAIADATVAECVDVNGVLTCPEPAEKAAAANCTIEYVGSGEQGDDGASQLNVTVTGMYPSYHCKVSFKVQSLGNVPVHVWLPKAVGTIPAWVATDFENCYTDGTQLHQNGLTTACTMDLHFTNAQAPVENSGPYTFSWTILATQWNEDPAAPANIITVTSGMLNFGPTGWGGWSCPASNPYVVSATNNAPLGVTQQLLWQPGATTGTVNYPNTPFGYTYGTGEEGSIVQNINTGQSFNIILQCSNQP